MNKRREIWELDFPKSHDVEALVMLLGDEESGALKTLDLSALESCAVDVRYPGVEEPEDPADVLNTVQIALKVKTAVQSLLKIHIS